MVAARLFQLVKPAGAQTRHLTPTTYVPLVLTPDFGPTLRRTFFLPFGLAMPAEYRPRLFDRIGYITPTLVHIAITPDRPHLESLVLLSVIAWYGAWFRFFADRSRTPYQFPSGPFPHHFASALFRDLGPGSHFAIA